MSTHDYIAGFSSYSDSSHGDANKDLGEADLRLSLSLPVAHFLNNERKWEKEYPRPLIGDSLSSMTESQQSFESWVPREHGITFANGELLIAETIDGEEQSERSLVRLQMSGPSYQQKQGSSDSEDSDNEAVGWPPVQTCRKNMICAKQMSSEHENVRERMSNNFEGESEGSSNFVKVVMDGMSIGRKVDLSRHNSYDNLVLTLDHIFQPSTICKSAVNSLSPTKHSSNYLLTYLDKDGRWMVVGDAPWGVFVKSVKRLRIAKG